MKEVNDVNVLPNPIPWYVRRMNSIRSTIAGAQGLFRHHKQEDTRVSRILLSALIRSDILSLVQLPTLEAQRYPLPEDCHQWTLVHGFYALMGGFATKIPGNLPYSEKFLPTEFDETWFITESGLRS